MRESRRARVLWREVDPVTQSKGFSTHRWRPAVGFCLHPPTAGSPTVTRTKKHMDLRLARRWRRWTREVRPTLALAMPIMGGMIGHMLIGIADTIMVGRVGVVPLAASSFVNTITHLPFIFACGLLSAIAVLTAQAHGAKQPHEAGEVLRHGFTIAFIAGLCTLVVCFCLRPFLGWFGQPADVVAASHTYLILFGGSLMPAIVFHGCKQYCEALNRPWEPMLIMLGAVLMNVFLNWILIYGNWGAPALGLEGAGWATLIVRTSMALALIAHIARASVFRDFKPVRWIAPLKLDRFRQLFHLGIPVGVQHVLEVSAFAFAALMMGWISTDAIAAHQIAITCAATTFMFGLGIGMAVCIRVGHAWGAGHYQRMRRMGFVGIVLSASVMGFFGLVFVAAGTPIARCFIVSPAVITLGAQLLMVAAIFQVADGIQIVAMSGLRGQNDVRAPAMIAMLSYWIVAVPTGYLLAFRAQYGAVGIWIGLAIGLGAAATCLTWRFHERSKIAITS
ncbi:MAG: MATE family efflux transporter [Verrucomicrobia bacterium]|nr:MATE family efflux transporter [Verrucomicrobiota bacterium]